MAADLFNGLMNQSAVLQREYVVQLITPMAVHGADKNVADFRISSFRGITRYWWRVIQAETDMKALLEREETYFGGVTKQESGGKSPIRFSWDHSKLNPSSTQMLPHRRLLQNETRDEKYLRGSKSQALNAGQSISLSSSVTKTNKNDYHNILEFTFMLASMGQRSRRGFGAMQWEQHSFDTVQEYIQHLKALLLQLGCESSINGNQLGLTTLLEVGRRPVLKAVWVGAAYDCYESVLKDYGLSSHERIGDRSLGGVEGRKFRFASPLWGTVRKINGKYYPIISELQSQQALGSNSYEQVRNKFLKRMGVKL
ncbi:type III-B CRISPR module RAMP protein Cmr1 [Paenibacillus sp. FSL L8-0638]|uniref:type III-B CRISPR module RAMP protein Cmr1 n=1 Tax=Paenibacillus TaxID=44249 RepID=UPI003158DDB2